MKEKCKRVCTISAVVLIIYIFVPAIFMTLAMVTGFVDGWNDAAAEGPSDTPFWLLTLILIVSVGVIVVHVAPVVTAIKLLLGIRKNDSPFTQLNGKRIGAIGIYFMIREPLMFLYMGLGNGEWDFSQFTGFYFSAGLVLYCISLIFRYGCELQQESDETL